MNIWIAASDGKIDLVEGFLNQGLSANDKDPNGYTPVHAAASYGHIELLSKLCTNYGGDINIQDNDGDTPLHHCEDLETVKFIVDNLNGNYQLPNNDGKTLLQVLEDEDENPEIIQYLRKKCGIVDTSSIDKDELSQFKNNIRYTLENESLKEDDPASIQRRKKLEQILESDNSNAELEKYIREIIQEQFINRNEDSIKRRK